MHNIKQKCEESMKKLNFILLVLLPLFLFAESGSEIELNGLIFTNPESGVFVRDYQSVTTESVREMPNYYMRMAFFIGTEDNIISGNGNESLRNISEWNSDKDSRHIDTTNVLKQKILVYESNFYDAKKMIGHKNMGVEVSEKIYKIKQSDAMIFEYEVKPENIEKEMSIGCYFDFDIPDGNNKCNPYNDEVIIDPKFNFIYMTNKGEPTSSMIPTIFPLSSNTSYYVYNVKEETYNDKKIWEIISNKKSNSKNHFSEKSDYRFIMYQKPQKIDETGLLKFSFVLFHSYGKKSIESMTSEIDKYFTTSPKLSKNNTPRETKNPSLPKILILSENYPNPFNPTTKFKVSIPEQTNLNIKIYDISGELIRNIHTGVIPAGRHQFLWDGKNMNNSKVASGLYFIRAESSGVVKMNKIMLVR